MFLAKNAHGARNKYHALVKLDLRNPPGFCPALPKSKKQIMFSPFGSTARGGGKRFKSYMDANWNVTDFVWVLLPYFFRNVARVNCALGKRMETMRPTQY